MNTMKKNTIKINLPYVKLTTDEPRIARLVLDHIDKQLIEGFKVNPNPSWKTTGVEITTAETSTPKPVVRKYHKKKPKTYNTSKNKRTMVKWTAIEDMIILRNITKAPAFVSEIPELRKRHSKHAVMTRQSVFKCRDFKRMGQKGADRFKKYFNLNNDNPQKNTTK